MNQPNFIFTSGKLELKSEDKNVYVEGYISTYDLDLVNDVVTKDCMLDMGEQMRSRVIKFDVEHEAFRGSTDFEREINKTKVPVAKVEDFLIDKKGMKVKVVLNKHSSRYEEVKGSIEDGFLDAFSIAYIPTKTKIIEKEGKTIRLLDKTTLLNVAFTGNPINTSASVTKVFAKSLEFLKEQEDNNHLSGTQIKLKEVKNMVDEEKETNEAEAVDESKQEEPETKDESKEESQDDSKEEATEDSKESGSEEDVEVKAMKVELAELKSEISEMKAILNKPLVKSTIEQKNVSALEVEENNQNPLDYLN